MYFVEIYKLDNNGNQNIIAMCKLADGETALCEGDDVFVKNLTQNGIYDYSVEPRQKLFPKDGKKFLENLKYAFKSGYLVATEVKGS